MAGGGGGGGGHAAPWHALFGSAVSFPWPPASGVKEEREEPAGEWEAPDPRAEDMYDELKPAGDSEEESPGSPGGRAAGALSLRNEGREQRAKRLAKMSEYAARRLANESAEERSVRLSRMSQYARRRLATETPEQRAKRLARMSAYARRRLASETPEQRRTRLARMSAYAARKQAVKKIMETSTSFLGADNS